MMSTELERLLQARGATFGTWLGTRLPTDFGDVGLEWGAARESCVVFAADFRALIGVEGGDRVSFLQGMLSNDVKVLEPGEGVPALQLSDNGKVLSDMRVYAEQERFLLDVLRWRADTVRKGLEHFLVADDVELTALEAEVPLLGLEGPRSSALATDVLGEKIEFTTPLAHRTLEWSGHPLRVAAASEVNGNGLLICGPPAAGVPLFEALTARGAVPLGMAALDILRVEGGVPWAGVDIDEEVLAMEAALEGAISFSKGCYLGQEIVERIAARGHVNRRRAGIVLDSDRVPPAGARLTRSGREVGRLTSVVRSELLGRAIALGYVHRDSLEPGSRIEVVSDGETAGASVTELPFRIS